MKSIGTHIGEIHKFETLALGETVIHKLHPFAKLCSALVFIIAVVSFGRYDFVPLAPFLFYPVIIAALAEIPYRALIPKLLIALPFCLFAGISNVIFDRNTAWILSGVPVSYGAVSLLAILLKMVLSVSAALLLTATTPLTELTAQLRRLRVPFVFVTVFEMTYRYIGVLLEETHSMTTAYRLRSKGKKALEMRHMGSFVGQLLLRGFDRAELVYSAMLCRGYGRREAPHFKRAFQLKDGLVLGLICALSCIFRFIRIV
jgi:cobalt/nickel transport system permease protein